MHYSLFLTTVTTWPWPFESAKQAHEPNQHQPASSDCLASANANIEHFECLVLIHFFIISSAHTISGLDTIKQDLLALLCKLLPQESLLLLPIAPSQLGMPGSRALLACPSIPSTHPPQQNTSPTCFSPPRSFQRTIANGHLLAKVTNRRLPRYSMHWGLIISVSHQVAKLTSSSNTC